MNIKLEKKLQEINSKDPILNDEDLMNALESIIDTEVNKPFGEMDTELLDSAVEFKLSVEGIDLDKVTAASEKHVEDYLSKFHKEVVENSEIKPKKNLKKPFKYVFAVAAVVAAMTVTIFATCIALDFDFMDLKTFLGLEREVEHNDGDYSLTITDTRTDYSNLADFVNNEDVDGLLLPTGEVKKISVINETTRKRIILELTIANSTIIVDYPIREKIENQNIIQIGKHDVVILDMNKQVQGIWFFKDKCYHVYTISIEQLTSIVNSLEEY